MLKLFGAILVFGSCAAIGLSAREVLKKRVKADSALLLAISILIRELKTNHTPLRDIFEMLAKNENTMVRAFFSALLEAWQENDRLPLRYHWCRAAQRGAQRYGWGEEETRLLCEMANFLGQYDAREQCVGLEQLYHQLEAMREIAKEELQNKGNLYRTCGISLGIMVILILI